MSFCAIDWYWYLVIWAVLMVFFLWGLSRGKKTFARYDAE